MNIEKLTKEIGRMDSAFIDEALDYKRKRSIIMSKKKLVAVIAAAVMIILTVTVSATAFTGLIGKEKAFEAARAYVMQNTDKRGKVSTWTLFLEGLEYDTLVEEKEVRLGLTAGLKSVYTVKFKIAGYAFDVTVDAKTGDVLDLSQKADEGWEEHLESVGFRGPADGIWEPEVCSMDAMNIAMDYFGLYNIGYTGCGVTGMCVSNDPNFTTEPYSFHVAYEHGGYIYSCDVNGTTGEVMNVEIAEDESYSGERHQHEPNHDLIGLYNSVTIAREALGISREDIISYYTIVVRYEPNEATLEYEGELLPLYNGYGTDVYIVKINQNPTWVEVAFDAYTGEIIEIVELGDPAAASDQEALDYEKEAKG